MNEYIEIEKLVRQAKEGRLEAKEELINKFRSFIIKKAQGIFIKNYDIEDLIQIGIMTILKSIDKYKLEKGNFVSYVTYAVMNNFNYEIRKKSKERFESSLNIITDDGLEILDLISSEDNLEDSYINKEIWSKLYEAINILSFDEKELIEIVYFKKVKIKDYAEKRGIKYGTVLKRKKVAMIKLKRYLESEE